MGESSDRDGATAVAELVYLLDEAFAGAGIEESSEAQSLLANVATVRDEQWRAVPNGGVRTVESIALLQHVTYHAGEINPIRSLLAEDDRWR
jgi:hypothetical protein